MKNINTLRKFKRNQKEPNPDGDYILYWMQINRRTQYNYALEYAVALSNKYDKPLLIYESVMVNYPWASDRFHTFLLEGMKEHHDVLKDTGATHYCYAENESGTVKQSFLDLAENAVAVVADEYPVYIIRENNEQLASEINVPYISIDSNGIIPLKVTDKDPYSAYLFRKVMQKHFLEAYTHPPKKDPLDDLKNHDSVVLPDGFEDNYPRADDLLDDIPGFISTLDINHDIRANDKKGTRQYALGKLGDFIAHGLSRYDEERNDPDADAASGLSPWLHFGLISEYEIVRAVLDHQPDNWDLDDIKPNNGKNSGFFNGDPNVESFLDEVITWR